MSHWQTTRWGSVRLGGGGAVFVVSENGDLEVYVDAAQAAAHLEAVDVDSGEYPVAYRVDGAVLEVLADGESVVMDLTGDVDTTGLQAAIRQHALRLPSAAPAAATPLDVAEAWLRQEWEARRSHWSHRLKPRRWREGGPPTSTELAAPPGTPRPALVHRWRMREVVDEVLAALPPRAAIVSESASDEGATVHLQPRTVGAVDVMIWHDLMRVDVSVAGSAALELSAPNNINWGPPERPWRDDVRDILLAVSQGLIRVGIDDNGRVGKVEMPDHRSSMESNPHGTLRFRRPPAWQ